MEWLILNSSINEVAKVIEDLKKVFTLEEINEILK